MVALTVAAFSSRASAQDERGNDRPKIEGQRSLSTDEDQPITIYMTDLEVEDDDDYFYPWGFTMTLYPGENYSFSGHIVTPAPEFNGTLTVPVSVNDGKDESQKYKLKINVRSVNDRPVITGQDYLETTSGVPITVRLSDLDVRDPDDDYPDDFRLDILQGENYTVDGDRVTPSSNFSGMLTVRVRVDDGDDESEVFALQIDVKKADPRPVITNQTPVLINEGESFSVALAHLTVNDPENRYPSGFSIVVHEGNNYTADGSQIIPHPDFAGNLFVPLIVTDGTRTSPVYEFLISIRPVDDRPVISLRDSAAIRPVAGVEVAPFEGAEITDADDEIVFLAEVSFDPSTYREGEDVIAYSGDPDKIRGVFDARDGVLALIGEASHEEYQQALASVKYTHVANEEAPSSRPSTYINVVVSDGQNQSNNARRRISFSDDEAPALDIPNGFTPNGDFVNDTWSIRALESIPDAGSAVVRVYTRTGKLVFEGKGLEQEWDGRYNGSILPPDTYFYTVDLPVKDPTKRVRGFVTILR